MAHEQEKDNKRPQQYPLDSDSYKLLSKIGDGVSAIVYKAVCETMNSSVVAIKSIDLDRSRANFDDIRREAKTLSLLSHPNILNAHCSFTVDHRIWVVMPFMSSGSLQSIISSCFPDGLPESCIVVVLKETLKALCYLHNQGHLHRDIKAGNILVDENGAVKLADFGVSASLYEWGPSKPSSSSSSLMLNDIAGTPYWMAPEMIHSHVGYSFKADIWSFGITALELAHGRPPLSHLPPSKSLLMKLTNRHRFWDYEKSDGERKKKKVSKAFKDVVASCLQKDPSKRPSADKLLKHAFFKNCKGSDYLIKNLLQGLPSVEDRFKERKTVNNKGDNDEDHEDEGFEGESSSQNVKQRRISGWNFNEEVFELDPVFPTESKDDSVVKQVRFGGETIIQDQGSSESLRQSSLAGELAIARVGEEGQGSGGGDGAQSDEGSGSSGLSGGVVDKDLIMEKLKMLKSSLDDQRKRVNTVMGMLGEDDQINRDEKLEQEIEKLKVELENEKKKNTELQMEVEFLMLRSDFWSL